MSDYLYLVPIAFALGLVTLAVFVWCLRSGQYEDLDGAAERILFEEEDQPSHRSAATERILAPAQRSCAEL
jgi:cbb3-type cytochrome oxidase maturation protein